MNISEIITPLERIACVAGRRILEIYKQPSEASYKNDGSPVTLADKEAEALILPVLAEIAPQIPVISEENIASHSLSVADRFFLVDPLDGTREFLKRDGMGAFTVNIALIDHGFPVLGIVYAPALDQLFVGVDGTGAIEQSEGKRQKISVRKVPASGAIAVTSLSHRDSATDQWLCDHCIVDVISIGSSLKFCLLANGKADIYPRFGPTMEWDVAAGDAVLRAAGGQIIFPDATPFCYGKKNYRNGAFIAYGDPVAKIAISENSKN